MERQCPVCEGPIRGRSDKVFCSPNCKSAYQYEHKKKEEALFYEIDRQLKINRKILKKYNKAGRTVLRRAVLLKEGFNPRYFTHYWKNKKGQVYLFSYDFGVLKIEEERRPETINKYLIVEWQEAYMQPSN